MKSAQNKYCKSSDLTNEASVESFFVMRMLQDFGYNDKDVKTKVSIDSLNISKGRGKEPYKPDYLITAKRKPRWIIDAKATTENIDDFVYQCAGYSLLINQKHTDRPVKYFLLTNGLATRVYDWDQAEPILSLHFDDFVEKNSKYIAIKNLLSFRSVEAWDVVVKPQNQHKLERPPTEEIKKTFLRCHRIIWKSEKISPQAAFFEFAKLLFIKINEDKKIKDNGELYKQISAEGALPPEKVTFSTRWISQLEDQNKNPLNDILFKELRDKLEEEITSKGKKRILEPNENLNLSPGTTKRIVAELEHYYLFGIDEDLNGRMFETFLSATMRGQELGQYFTPRSITKLVVRLANLKASKEKVDHIIDSCCGTGGFLIEALTAMRRLIQDNSSLLKSDREKLLNEVANEAIFGIDAGRNPEIARIARLNMYLHGDGGSRIYMTDALRKVPQPSGADTLEVKNNVKELREWLEEKGNLFDAVLTNPPFSMDYSESVVEEKEVLDGYELLGWSGKKRKSLRSSVMFIERYWDILKPGGRLITVIDDSVLSSKSFSFVRDFIRHKFVVRAVISLHGDAFQRSGARAKTSILYLEKCTEPAEQPDIFVYESQYLGVDDVVPKTPHSVAEAARQNAETEMREIDVAFKAYLSGEKGPWLVEGAKLVDRLDVKHLQPWSVSKLEPAWKKLGTDVAKLEDLVNPIDEQAKLQPDKSYSFLRITYTGRTERGEKRLGREISYTNIGTAKVGDIVVSNIGAVYGSITVIPEGMEELLTSSEFTVMRLKDGIKADPWYLWSILRSPAVLAQWISDSSGVSRHRVGWAELKKQVVPLLPYEKQKEIGNLFRSAVKHEEEAIKLMKNAGEELTSLELDAEEAKSRLRKAKPPR